MLARLSATLLLAALCTSCIPGDGPESPSPTVGSTPTATATKTLPGATPTRTVSGETPTATARPETPTAEATASPTRAPTATPGATATANPTASRTPTPTLAPTPPRTPTATPTSPPTPVPDDDGDGAPNDVDCDDANPDVRPGGVDDTCDGVDDDCSGVADEEFNAAETLSCTCRGLQTVFVCTDGVTSCPALFNAEPEQCDGEDNDCDGATDEDFDADEDGYISVAGCVTGVGEDCADEDPGRHPGVEEVCDAVDQDCDGAADEGLMVVFYADEDSDGWGDDDAPVSACSQPEGVAAVGGDCDDQDPAVNPDAVEDDCGSDADLNCDGSVAFTDADGDGYAACEECDDADENTHPGSAERCDGADEDCDGRTDEGFDADGDGASGCATAAGETDCDDTNASVEPGRSEVCNNGVDDNCDGAATGCAWSSTLTTTATNLTVTAADYGSLAGYAPLIQGDLNKDGYPDLVLGEPYRESSSGLYRSGVVTVFFGKASLPSTYSTSSPSATIQGFFENGRFGQTVAVGDVDGDGGRDLLIGSDGYSEYGGEVLLVYNNTLSAGENMVQNDGTTAQAVFFGASASRMGASVAAGDINGDGCDDVIAGAPYYSTDKGAVFIWFGIGPACPWRKKEGDLPVTTPRSGPFATSTADVKIYLTSSGRLGTSLAVMDTDGDRKDDLWIGARTWETTSVDQGGVFLLLGKNLPIGKTISDINSAASYSFRLTGEVESEQAGYALASVGDVTGDGEADLLVGAPYRDYTPTRCRTTPDATCPTEEDVGAVYLISGQEVSDLRAAGTTSFDLTNALELYTRAAKDALGARLGYAGDLNNDGVTDLVVGTSRWFIYDNLSSCAGGAAYVLYGPIDASLSGSGLTSSADVRLSGSSTSMCFGSPVAGGDYNRDGLSDLIIASPYLDPKDKAYFFYGKGL